MTETLDVGAVHVCHRCGEAAATQWGRAATAAEAETWWSLLEQRIRQANQGMPGAAYVADRTDAVTVAVHGCEQHPVPNPHLLHNADCGGHGQCGCGTGGSRP